MAPDLTTLEPYDWPRWAVKGMTDEPDHTMVPFGGYKFDPEVTPREGRWFYLGLIDKCYGATCLNAQSN